MQRGEWIAASIQATIRVQFQKILQGGRYAALSKMFERAESKDRYLKMFRVSFSNQAANQSAFSPLAFFRFANSRFAILFAVTTFLVLSSGTAALVAQTMRINDLPGWDAVQDASAKMQSIRVFRPGNLNWDEGTLFFSLRKDGKQTRMQMDLATGEIGDADEEAESEADNSSAGNQARANVGRARQRLWIRSADAKWKASYRNLNIVLEQLDEEGEVTGEPIQVTSTGTEKHRFGTACWVYGEELDQQDAMWFSPDSSKLAFYEINETHMKTYFLTTGNTANYTDLHKEQYPTAGQDNPHVKLHIYDIESKQTIQVDVEGPVDQYIYDIEFSPGGEELIFHRTNRWQNEMDVMAADVKTGKTRVIVSEKQETWQKNSPLMQFLDDGQHFVWETERTGWKQFELRNISGDKICDLTPSATYPVHRVVKVDEENKWFYYSAYSDENPLNLHLHRSRLDGTENMKLTSGEMNFSGFQISPDHQHFVANYETISVPPSTGVWRIDSGNEKQVAKVGDLASSNSDAVTEAGLVPGELFSFKSEDGTTEIYGTLYKPHNFDPNKKYPLLIDVYGGPNSVGVTNRYRAANPFCELGFLVAKIGNRGTVNRGKAFESANYGQLGLIDLDDQAAGVRFLAEREYVDGDRVGISGHSYGGYMSALALLRYPDLFHVGVAGAPVTDWRNYDTIYTERYMKTPQENKSGYDEGSCLTHVNKLKGKLFILHGLVDDNVHPSNTWQLVDKLHKANKRFDLMVYPNSAHGFRYTELKWDYFIRNLKPEVSTKQAQNDNN